MFPCSAVLFPVFPVQNECCNWCTNYSIYSHMGFWCFFCLQRQLFVQNPHRVTILHLPVSSIITVSVHWGICVCAHLCFRVSVSESLWLSLCQYSSFCSSVWPAPCPITESCSGLSSLSSMFSSPRCDIYFRPRSTFVVSFSLIVTRSHLLFFFFCFHSPSPLSQVLF